MVKEKAKAKEKGLSAEEKLELIKNNTNLDKKNVNYF